MNMGNSLGITWQRDCLGLGRGGGSRPRHLSASPGLTAASSHRSKAGPYGGTPSLSSQS